MKKIINGKKYNTETAKPVAFYESNLPKNDFGYCEEVLYRKKTGEFFIYGSGNASSRYRKQVETNTWSGGEEIIPLTEEKARKWAERSIEVEDYERIFGEVEE